MSQPLFSSSWHRVEALKPALRGHVRIHRQRYRGQLWYVLQDPAKDQFLRFTPEAYTIIASMRGEQTVAELWAFAIQELGENAPTQDDLVQLLGQLHSADLILCDVTPDAAELFERAQRQERSRLFSRVLNPFAIQIHLFNPDRWLAMLARRVGPLLGWIGGMAWLAIVLPAVALAATNWKSLTENWSDQLFSADNAIAVGAMFIVLKAFHELGHGLLAKKYGGHVYSMGVSLLVLAPVPYVDASSSWAFTSKYQRALVGAGGMIFEIFLAALALYIWLGAEPGLLRALAYNAIIVGGLTTLLFNANPLMRFDGYYIVSDLLELPNLRPRSNQYVQYLAVRYLLGDQRAQRPQTAPGEPGWFIVFWVLAGIYRIIVTIAILTWVVKLSLVLGTVMGGAAVITWFGMPLYKGGRYLLSQRSRGAAGDRVFVRAVTMTAAALVLFAALPLPLRTTAEGVIWLPEDAFVRAGTDAFVRRVRLQPGARVTKGDVVVEADDPTHRADFALRAARVVELESRQRQELTRNAVGMQLLEEELRNARQQLASAREDVERLEIRTLRSGVLSLPKSEDLPGRFVKKGELLGYVLGPGETSARAVISQDNIELVRDRTVAVEVRVAGRLAETYETRLARISPAAQSKLPSNVLTRIGGGKILADPRDPEGQKALATLFEVEVALPNALQGARPGTRVYLRLDHGYQPLILQVYRGLKQTFLKQLAV